MEQARIERSVVLALAADDAWRRIVFGFSDWFGREATLEPRTGGRVTNEAKTGHVTTYREGSLLRWEWSADGDPGWTEIEISLHPADRGTEVRVVEVLQEWEQVTYPSVGVGSSHRSDSELVVSTR
jgi:hypothetical protein